MAANTIATAYIQLVPTLQGVQGAVAKGFAGSGIEAEADKAGKRAGGSMLGGLSKVAGPAAVAGAVAGIATGLYKIGGTFDDLSDTIRVATGKTGTDLDAMVDQAKKIGGTVPVEFDKIGPALSTVAQRLGATGGDLEKITSQFLAAGNVLGTEIDIDKATASFTAFGLKGADVSTAMDDIFKISQQTGVGFDEITSKVQASAPALQQLGFSFRDSAALVGSFDKAGLNSGAMLGGMSKAMVKLAKDGKDPQAAFKDITGQISGLVAQGKDAEAINLAAGLFGTKGAAQFVQATKNGALNVDELTASVAASGETILGAQADTADFAEQWTMFKNKALTALEPVATKVFGLAGEGMGALNTAFDAVSKSIGPIFDLIKTGDFKGGIFGLEEDSPVIGFFFALRDAFAGVMPIFKEVGGTLGKAFMDVWDTLSPTLAKLLPVVIDLMTVFNPVSLIFKALLPVLPQIAEVFGNLARTLAGVLATALDAIVPILADLAAAVLPPLMGLIQDLVPFFVDLGEIAGEVAGVLGKGIADALTALTPLFDTLVGVIGELIPFVADLVKSLLPPLLGLFDSLVPLIQGVLDVIIPLVGTIVDALIPVIESLMPIVKTVFEFIATTIGNVVKVFQGLIDVITGIFTGDWEKVWNGVKDIFGAIWDQIKAIFSTLWEVISTFFSELAPKIWDIIKGAASWLAERGGEFLAWLWQGIQDKFPEVLAWFGSLAGWLWEKILAGAAWVLERGKEFFGWLISGITAKAEELWTWIKNLPSAIWNKIKEFTGDTAQWVADRGGEFMGWLVDGITDGAEALWAWITGPISDPNSLIGGLWSAMLSIKDKILEFGSLVVGWIGDGIEAGVNLIVDAIAGLFGGLSFTDNGELSAISGYTVAVGLGAGGGVLPGYAPGRDVVPALLSPGEGVLVPEAVRMLGPGWVYDINRKARGGRHVGPDSILGTQRFAAGGLVGLGQQISGWFGKEIEGGAEGWLKDMVEALLGGAIGKLFPPTSFEGNFGPPNSAGLAANAAAAMAFITNAWGLTNIGGWRAQGSVPGSDHPRGKALDVMIPNYRSEAGIALGNSIANWFLGNPGKYGTKYVIWRDRYNDGGGWSSYSHPSGNNDTLAHRDHVHLSFLDKGGWLMPGQVPVNMLREPEPVLTPQQWRAAEQAIELAASGRATPTLNFEVYQQPGQSPAELAREIDRQLAFAGRMS